MAAGQAFTRQAPCRQPSSHPSGTPQPLALYPAGGAGPQPSTPQSSQRFPLLPVFPDSAQQAYAYPSATATSIQNQLLNAFDPNSSSCTLVSQPAARLAVMGGAQAACTSTYDQEQGSPGRGDEGTWPAASHRNGTTPRSFALVQPPPQQQQGGGLMQQQQQQGGEMLTGRQQLGRRNHQSRSDRPFGV